MLRACALQD
jgi:hypothetical protein